MKGLRKIAETVIFLVDISAMPRYAESLSKLRRCI